MNPMQAHARQSGWKFVAPGNGPAIATSLTAGETAMLRELATGRKVLEVGSAWGYSAVVMALAGADVTAVDNHSWLPSLPVMQAHLEAYGVTDRVTIRQGWSFDELPKLKQKFGLIFIDGNHDQWAVEKDLRLSLPLLDEHGVLALHDYGAADCPGVKAAAEILGEPDEIVDSLAVFRR